jgi:hypothetical protein
LSRNPKKGRPGPTQGCQADDSDEDDDDDDDLIYKWRIIISK